MAEQTDVRPVGARTRRRRHVRRQTRRSFFHTTLALIPGAGLLGTRYRRLGWVMLGLLAAMVIVVTLFVLAKGAVSAALNVAVRPDALLAVAGLTVVGGLVWIFSIILTHRGTAPDRVDGSNPWGLRLFTAFICLLVAIPAIQVVRYSLIQRDVVSTVFTGPAVGGLTPSALQTATPEAQAPDPWADVDRVNLLLLGSDAGNDREGTRTDSMVEVSIDPQTGNAVLISIPRSLERAPFPSSNPLHKLYPNGYYCPAPLRQRVPHQRRLVARRGEQGPLQDDPNPGLTTIRDVIGEVTGLHVDYSTVIDLAGFQKLVDAMGGVTSTSPSGSRSRATHTSSGRVAGIEGWIEPGRQTLDGYHALWYARSRATADDFSRMRRQRCLIGALLDQVNPVKHAPQVPRSWPRSPRTTSRPTSQWRSCRRGSTSCSGSRRASITSLTFTSNNISPATRTTRRCARWCRPPSRRRTRRPATRPPPRPARRRRPRPRPPPPPWRRRPTTWSTSRTPADPEVSGAGPR